MKRYFILVLLAISGHIVKAQCSEKKCSDIYAEWGFSMQIVNEAYIPTITHTDENCYITLQSEIQELNLILAKYKIVNFYRYIDGLHSDNPLLNQAYILVCDPDQYELGEELRSSFPEAIPFIEHWECFPQTNVNIASYGKSYFYQHENYLIFNEGIPRTINFYSIDGKKILSIESAEKEINPSQYLESVGMCIIEVIENDLRYSGKYIN